MEDLAALGAQAADSPADVASKCQVIITMLPNSPQVREVCLGENGILETIENYRRRASKERNPYDGRPGQRRGAESDRRNPLCYGRRTIY